MPISLVAMRRADDAAYDDVRGPVRHRCAAAGSRRCDGGVDEHECASRVAKQVAKKAANQAVAPRRLTRLMWTS